MDSAYIISILFVIFINSLSAVALKDLNAISTKKYRYSLTLKILFLIPPIGVIVFLLWCIFKMLDDFNFKDYFKK